MECLANGAAVAQRLGDIAFSLVAPVLHATRPCYTANRIAVQETLLLDSKTVCCTAIAVARQQKPFAAQQSPLLDSKNRLLHSKRRCKQQNRLLHSNRPLLDSKTVCCTAIRAAMQQTDFPRSNSVFIVQESG